MMEDGGRVILLFHCPECGKINPHTEICNCLEITKDGRLIKKIKKSDNTLSDK